MFTIRAIPINMLWTKYGEREKYLYACNDWPLHGLMCGLKKGKKGINVKSVINVRMQPPMISEVKIRQVSV